MRAKHTVHNINEDVKSFFIRFAYIIAPTVGLFIYFIFKKLSNFNIDDNFVSNLINVSGILAGFLFTSLGIIISLPENKFIQLLKDTGYMKIIYNSMIIGIITLLIAMLLGMFNFKKIPTELSFIIGISETFLSAYYLYRVSYYSGKSK